MNHTELYRAENLPVLQNRVFSTAREALESPTGNVILVQNLSTGLIYNAAFDSTTLKYDETYQNEQSYSGVFRKHLDDVQAIIGRYFRGCSLVEIGCGKGHFLQRLRSEGFDVRGVDPAYEGDDPHVIKAAFNAELGLSVEGIVLRHVLEHVEDPLGFLADIARANGGKGRIYLEVPCFDWICSHRAWFDIFYEHVNYFRISDFYRIFSRVDEAGHLFQGQYLYVVADLSSLRVPEFGEADRVQMPGDFLSRLHQLAAIGKAAKDKTNIVWGGASKGVIFSIFMHRAGMRIDAVIDINPAKQGKFLAGSGLRVSSPNPDLLGSLAQGNMFVMNSNYLPEIVERSGAQFNYITVDHE